jgi:hypothetical protein
LPILKQGTGVGVVNELSAHHFGDSKAAGYRAG